MTYLLLRNRQRGVRPAGGIGGSAFNLVSSFAGLAPDDFMETFEAEPEWCDGCDLPREACVCPEGDDEFDEDALQ